MFQHVLTCLHDWHRIHSVTMVLLLLPVLFLMGCSPPEAVAPTATPIPATATVAATATPLPPTQVPEAATFSGEAALDFVAAQMALGPRFPGSEGHLAVRELIADELSAAGWTVERQAFEYRGFEAVNMVGKRGLGRGPIIIIGAHYDSRARADQSPDHASEPVPAAVDGASGVAVLLELANSLDLENVDAEIWLAFFDVEDNGSGGLPGWDWIQGSTYMAAQLEPDTVVAMILVDMVGQEQQEFFLEGNSDRELRDELWTLAAELGFAAEFIATPGYTMTDDHVPFAKRGIPAVDIIDFDYPYWHTVDDTIDKMSPTALEHVGLVIENWLEDG